jgi:DNA-binding protein
MSEQPTRDPNTIYVGKKPVMNYVLACLTVLQSGAETVTVKARGRTISTAVDVAQILTKRFATDVGIKNIDIGTEQVKSVVSGQTSNVSSIEIVMGK